MNEITRIHIAKTAYDIEIAAKKQLEKYIKSLEIYTQDSDVLADIEIRITELLTERGVAANGVIGSDDVAAVRAQLGEPHEFADGESDIAVGASTDASGRRLYRSTDNAVLGGVLSGIAAYFGVNPVWTRLVFVMLLFISFGFVSLVYILFWIITPPARTATEKLRLAGKDVTVESIKELSADEESARPSNVAPIIRRILFVSLGALSAVGAIVALTSTVWLVIVALTANASLFEAANGFIRFGEGAAWIVWTLFWVVVFGLALLTALFTLIAYAFFAQKLTKRMVVSGIIIMVLGIVSAATVIGVSATQSWRVANEARSMMRETKANLPKEFANIKSIKLSVKAIGETEDSVVYFSQYASVRYVVDDGPARYELNALPSARTIVTTNGQAGSVTLEVPSSFRNSFVQPSLTIYGPAVQKVETDAKDNGTSLSYNGTTQSELTVESMNQYGNVIVAGTYEKVVVKGIGSVDLGEGTVGLLDVQTQERLMVSAGTVRELTVVQPDVCPSGSRADSTSVRVWGVTSGAIMYNGKSLPVATHETACGSVIIESEEESYGVYENEM